MLPLFYAIATSKCQVGHVPGPDLFMANRYAPNCTPPPFLHCYGSNKAIMDQWLSRGVACALPEALWGREGHPPLCATKLNGQLRQWQFLPNLAIDFSRVDPLPCTNTPAWQTTHPVLLPSLWNALVQIMGKSGGSDGGSGLSRASKRRALDESQQPTTSDLPATVAESHKHWLVSRQDS